MAFLLAIVALFILLPSVLAEGPTLGVKGYELSENVNPGDNFQVSIVLALSEEKAEDIDVQLRSSYPISAVGASERYVNEMEKGEERKLKYELKVEETASEGTYPVDFLIDYEDSDGNRYSKDYVINIPVRGIKELTLYLSGSSETDLYSGETATLIFAVLNGGSVQVDSLVARASAGKYLSVKWNSKVSVIGKLSPQESVVFEVIVEVSKTAETGRYPLGVRLQGENFRLENAFEIPVKSKSDFEVRSVEAEGLSPGADHVPITVHLTNEGRISGEEVEGRLTPEFPFSTKETTKFIPEVKSGGEGKMIFWLDIDEDADPGSYGLDLSLEYNAWDEDFSETLKVPITIERGKSLDIWGSLKNLPSKIYGGLRKIARELSSMFS